MSEAQRGPRKRKRLTFTQRDVARAIRAAESAGMSIARIRISRDGDIDIVPGEAPTNSTTENEWDDVK